MPTFKKADIANSFSLAAKAYDQHAFIQKEIGKRLLERLTLMKATPEIILDIGAGTGFLTRQCQQKFPKSHIFGLDFAKGMIQYANSKQPWQPWKNKPVYIGGDAECLPFKNNSVDLIFSNFTFQWCENITQVFNECKRVLKPNGMLFFSTLGPSTLIELRQSWQRADSISSHVNEFTDMHDIGDALLSSNFLAPIMDMEILTVQYQNVQQILKDLKATGAHNMNEGRHKGFMPKSHFKKMLEAYEEFKQGNQYPCTFEIIYGHACQQPMPVYREKEEHLRIPGKIRLIPNAV